MKISQAKDILKKCFHGLKIGSIYNPGSSPEWWKFLVNKEYIFRFPKLIELNLNRKGTNK